MNLFYDINAFLLAFFISLITVPLLRRWAIRTDNLDIPDERKVHEHAIPRLGGIAIVLSFLFTVLIFLEINMMLRGLLFGLLIIFMIGLLDDLVGLSAKQKFVGQIVAALLTVLVAQLYITNLGNLFGFGPVILPFWLVIPFTVFAVVGVTNAINMIDGLDGLSGGVSVLAVGAFALFFFAAKDILGLQLCIILAGALFGFLKHNSYPARIFMGDAGSLSLGFLLSFLAIYLTQGEGAMVSPAVPVLVLGLPIADTLKVMARRVMKKKSPFAPDMTHVHHSFLNLGLEHRFTVILIYSWSFFWCLFAYHFQNGPAYFLIGVYLLCLIGLYRLIHFMRHRRDRFRLFDKDSARSLRESDIYAFSVTLMQRLMPLLVLLFVGYLAITITVVGKDSGAAFSYLAFLIFIAGIVLGLSTVERRIRFEFIFYAAAALFVVFLTEQAVHLPVESSINYHLFSNVMFTFIVLFVVCKIIFRPEDTVYLTSPLDYLFLAMIVALIFVPGDVSMTYKFPSAILKTIFFILALKIFVTHGRRYRRVAFWGLQLTLLVIFIKSF